MIEFTTKRYYTSVYHDPVFDGVLYDENLNADQTGAYTMMEFSGAQVSVSGTFGSSPFSQSSNLRITTASGNPAAGASFSNPMFWGEFSAAFMKSLANNNKAYVLFAIPMAAANGDTIYMTGFLDEITWAGGTNEVYFKFKVSFIKNSYDPNTASGADKLFTSTWDQRSCGVVFSSSKILFGVSRILAKNDTNQFIPESVQELVNFPLDTSVLVFTAMHVYNNTKPELMPTLGSMVKFQIESNNRALQAATQPNVSSQTNAGLMFVAPAYVEANYNCKISYESKLISNEVGETSTPGGYEDGTFEYEHDQIVVTPKPVLGMTTSGMYHVYRVYNYQLAGIGAEIIPKPIITPPAPNTGTDVTTAIKDGIDKLTSILTLSLDDLITAMLEQKLIDYIVDLHLIPCQPPIDSLDNVKVGWKTLESQAYPITTDYVDISCGRIQTGEFYASFADYLTRVKLFLPFVGFVPVQPEWFQNATIGVDYRINVIDGSFMCYITGYGQHINKGMDHGYRSGLLAQYSGNACIHMPITGTNYSTMLSGAIGAGLSLAASAGTGNLLGVAGSAISAMNAAPEVVQSNSYSASAAILSHRKPFLMIARPTSHYSALYQHELGIPANITARLGDLGGFVQMTNVHLDGIRGTERERRIIAEKLAKGVIV